MLVSLLIIVLSTVFITFMGYWAHKAFHQPWAGVFFTSHSEHHDVKYPPSDFLSASYRSAGAKSSVYYFSYIFIFVMLFVMVGMVLFGFSILNCACALVSMIITALINNEIHDATHLNKTVWQHLPWYKRWQELHLIHHQDQQKNFGIINFSFDKLFGTFKE